ncbi:MAG: BREX-3 system P-loop-containing protein BrxF [Bacillaceae bacterium]|nr:BREX-3 system P-loop-containing protein BrxF [Bacillaceae bacterium]
MYEEMKQSVQFALEQLEGRRHRLLLLVSEDQRKLYQVLNDVASKHQIPILNMNLSLSEELINVPVDRRPRKVGEIVEKILRHQKKDLVIISHIELLFDHSLHLNPIKLFEELSKTKTLIVGWNGKYENNVLSYADPGHSDYRSYYDCDAIIFSIK